MGWVLVAFAAWPVIHLVLSALFPAHLLLSNEGFRIGGFKPQPVIYWRDVDRFWVVQTPLYGYVMYALKGRPQRQNIGLWVFRGLPSEADGCLLPMLYQLDAVSLLKVLNDWKADHDA